jgi:hypothetical protein
MTVTAGGPCRGARLGWRHPASAPAPSRSCITRACRTLRQAMTAVTRAAGGSWKAPGRIAELPCRAGVRRANQLAAAAGPHPRRGCRRRGAGRQRGRHQRHPVTHATCSRSRWPSGGARRLDRGDDLRPGRPWTPPLERAPVHAGWRLDLRTIARYSTQSCEQIHIAWSGTLLLQPNCIPDRSQTSNPTDRLRGPASPPSSPQPSGRARTRSMHLLSKAPFRRPEQPL